MKYPPLYGGIFIVPWKSLLNGYSQAFALYGGEEHDVAVYAEFDVIQRGAVCALEFQAADTADGGGHVYLLQALILPFAFEYEAAACAKPLEVAAAPRIGESGQKLYIARVALYKHFAYARRYAEVAVYLEGRVRAPEVGQGVVLYKRAVYSVGVLLCARARPEA